MTTQSIPQPVRGHLGETDVGPRNLELDWQLPRPEGVDHELRIFTRKRIDDDCYLSTLRPHPPYLCALFPWRQIDTQSAHVYGVDAHRPAKELRDLHAESELGNCYDWLDARFVIVGIRISEDSEAFARNLQTFEQRNMEAVQFHLAVESGRQSLNDGGAQNGLCPVERESHGGGYHHCYQAYRADPIFSAGPACAAKVCAICHEVTWVP